MQITNTWGQPVPLTAGRAVVVTKSDVTVLPICVVYIGTGGDIKVLTPGATDPVIFKNVPDAYILPCSVTKVFATDSTAEDIVALS